MIWDPGPQEAAWEAVYHVWGMSGHLTIQGHPGLSPTSQSIPKRPSSLLLGTDETEVSAAI